MGRQCCDQLEIGHIGVANILSLNEETSRLIDIGRTRSNDLSLDRWCALGFVRIIGDTLAGRNLILTAATGIVETTAGLLILV